MVTRISTAHLMRNYLAVAASVCFVCTMMFMAWCSCDDAESPAARARREYGSLSGKTTQAPLPSTFLLIAVLSGPDEQEQRQTIRDTWLKLSSKGKEVFTNIFPIGVKGLSEDQLRKLSEEHTAHQDLVFLENLQEDYSNLARKTLQTMEYAYQNHKFSYLLKVDSDSFVRVGAVIKSLKDISHPRLYWGFLDGRAKPFRKGKWKESDWILCDRYLPYQLGGGYVLAYELVRFLSTNARILKLYKSEDVSVGAWLAGLDIKYLHDPRFDTEFASRGCNNQYIITHKKKPDEMRELYTNLVELKTLCKREFRSRPSYVYDFAAVPSECCKRDNSSNIP